MVDLPGAKHDNGNTFSLRLRWALGVGELDWMQLKEIEAVNYRQMLWI